MGKAAAMKWDPESERKLWLSIILELAPSMSSINWDNVNDRVGVEGCTAAACKKKLDNTKTKLGMRVGGDKTPKKDDEGTPKAGGKKKRKAAASDDDDEEPKAKKANGGIKAEVEDEDGLI